MIPNIIISVSSAIIIAYVFYRLRMKVVDVIIILLSLIIGIVTITTTFALMYFSLFTKYYTIWPSVFAIPIAIIGYKITRLGILLIKDYKQKYYGEQNDSVDE